MKKLTDFIKKKETISTKPIEVKEFWNRPKIALSVELLLILEKYNPKIAISKKIPRKRFFDVESRSLTIAKIKHKEKSLVHSCDKVFNISLNPFINLEKFKLENSHYLDGRYITNSIKHLILHNIKEVKFIQSNFEILEIGFVNNDLLASFEHCHVNKLILKNIKHFDIKTMKIKFNSIQIMNCESTFDDVSEILKRPNLVDLSYSYGNCVFELLRNNGLKNHSLKLRNCTEIPFDCTLDGINTVNIDNSSFLKIVNGEDLQFLRYCGHDRNFQYILSLSLRRKLKKLDLSNSGIPQNILWTIVSNCRRVLRVIDITGIEISSDFLAFMKKNLKKCKVKYLNGETIAINNKNKL